LELNDRLEPIHVVAARADTEAISSPANAEFLERMKAELLARHCNNGPLARGLT
jgi:hypothetical protein